MVMVVVVLVVFSRRRSVVVCVSVCFVFVCVLFHRCGAIERLFRTILHTSRCDVGGGAAADGDDPEATTRSIESRDYDVPKNLASVGACALAKMLLPTKLMYNRFACASALACSHTRAYKNKHTCERVWR